MKNRSRRVDLGDVGSDNEEETNAVLAVLAQQGTAVPQQSSSI